MVHSDLKNMGFVPKTETGSVRCLTIESGRRPKTVEQEAAGQNCMRIHRKSMAITKSSAGCSRKRALDLAEGCGVVGATGD
jgi:hypothetical protein